MRQAFSVHPQARAGPVQQVDRALLQHAGPDPLQHVTRRLALQDDVVDAFAGQQLAEHQPSRAPADDGDLGAHMATSSWLRLPSGSSGREPTAGRLRLADCAGKIEDACCIGHEQLFSHAWLEPLHLPLVAALTGAPSRVVGSEHHPVL